MGGRPVTSKCSRPRCTVVEGIIGVIAHIGAIEAVIAVHTLNDGIRNVKVMRQEAVDLNHKTLQVY